MKTKGNTILITGGTAGIGFEIAKLFSANGNQVIITGRNKERLDDALSKLKNTVGILGDISKKEDIEKLVDILERDHPSLNMVVNNAGRALLHNLTEGESAYDIAADEMTTNYLAIIRLNQLLLPQLSGKDSSAIINVSSVVAIVPGSLSTYSASKAALHSYTQSLRIALDHSNTGIKVFELMPPLVDTEFSAIIGGENGIAPSAVASALFDGIAANVFEIRVGNTQAIYELYLKSPEEALHAMNRITE